MRHHCWRWMIGAALLVANLPAIAGLGGDAASVEEDRLRMNGASRVVKGVTPLFSVQEIRTQSGTVVREYLSASGKVFAVAWDGPRMPDLRQLLAGNFVSLETAQREKRGVSRPMRVETPELVVESAGHMRSFAGRAYVPALVPDGVSVDDLR
jgi:hypothetical protein